MTTIGSVPALMTSKPVLARCGKDAGLLWYQGRSQCDPYGRLPGDPEVLAGEVMKNWCIWGQMTVPEIEEARNALVTAGIWHLYLVNGQEYVEYIGFDEEQTESFLGRRARKPRYPDPPDRPDLWHTNRVRRLGKTDDNQPPPSSGSPAPAPPAAGPQGAIPGEGAAQSGGKAGAIPADDDGEELEGFVQLVACQEAYRGGSVVRESEKRKVRQILEQAQQAGVPWMVLLSVMKDRQIRAQTANPPQIIGRVEYYMDAWRDKIAEFQAGLSLSPPAQANSVPAHTETHSDTTDPYDAIMRARAELTGEAHEPS